MDSKVTLNVGGTHFMTYTSTLQRLPGTKLSQIAKTDANYDKNLDEFFFDRNPAIFEHILDYYRTGDLHFPSCMCGPSIQKELVFWGLDENSISPCCWKAFISFEDEKSTVVELAKTLGLKKSGLFEGRKIGKETTTLSESTIGDGDNLSLRERLWQFLEKPQSSKSAKIWSRMIFVLILISISVVVLETHPEFRVAKPGFNITNITINDLRQTNMKILMYQETDLHPVLSYIDGMCIIIFTIELLVRMLVCPSKLKFIKSFFNIIDIICVVPLFIVYILQLTMKDFWSSGTFFVIIAYLSLSSVLRVFRLFKLARHYRGLQILQLAVRSSMKELILLFMMITMGMLIFSTLVYFAEFNEKESHFLNIPLAFWWSIITMTTVGYGDTVPINGVGYVIGTFCAISGMLITGLPIPIIASNFNHYYNYARLTVKMSQKPPSRLCWKGNRDINEEQSQKDSAMSASNSGSSTSTAVPNSASISNTPSLQSSPSSSTSSASAQLNHISKTGLYTQNEQTSHRRTHPRGQGTVTRATDHSKTHLRHFVLTNHQSPQLASKGSGNSSHQSDEAHSSDLSRVASS